MLPKRVLYFVSHSIFFRAPILCRLKASGVVNSRCRHPRKSSSWFSVSEMLDPASLAVAAGACLPARNHEALSSSQAHAPQSAINETATECAAFFSFGA